VRVAGETAKPGLVRAYGAAFLNERLDSWQAGFAPESQSVREKSQAEVGTAGRSMVKVKRESGACVRETSPP
jgi:hypothetical protein